MAIVTALYFAATCLIFWQSKRSADAAWDAAKVADASLKVSQAAQVAIGRKDGVVADFIIPKDKTQKAEIIIYFQNIGHVPARFVWGTGLQFTTQGSQKVPSGIEYTQPMRMLPTRARDKRNGTITSNGEANVIPGDSTRFFTLGKISLKDLAEFPTKNEGVVVNGTYEYCDELGSYRLRDFMLGYRSDAPSYSLGFYVISETDLSTQLRLPPETDTTEYLPPCEVRRSNHKKRTHRTFLNSALPSPRAPAPPAISILERPFPKMELNKSVDIW